MAIEFQCPHCQKFLRTVEDKAGVRANCPCCGQSLTVPDPTEPADENEWDLPRAPRSGSLEETLSCDGGEDHATGQSVNATTCPACGEAIDQAEDCCPACGEILCERAARIHREIRAGEIFSHAWEIFKTRFGLLFGATLVLIGSGFILGVAAHYMRTAGGGAGPRIVFRLLQIAIAAYLQAGYHVLLLKVARGEEAEIGDLFAGGKFVVRFAEGDLFGLLTVRGVVKRHSPHPRPPTSRRERPPAR